MLEELEKIPLDKPFVYINLFKVDEKATTDDLRNVLNEYEIEDIYQNKAVAGVFDLKLKSREEFRRIIDKPRYMMFGIPFYFRFSSLIR